MFEILNLKCYLQYLIPDDAVDSFPLTDQDDIQDWEGEAVPEVPQEENWLARSRQEVINTYY